MNTASWLFLLSALLLSACGHDEAARYAKSPEGKKEQAKLAKEKEEQDGWKRLFDKTSEYASLVPSSRRLEKTSISEGLLVVSTLKSAKDQIVSQRILGFEEDNGTVRRATKSENDPYPTSTIKGRAQTPEEVAIIVQQDCKEGRKIGTYEVNEGAVGVVDLLDVNCEVRIINKRIDAVVAVQKFSNNKVPKDLSVKSWGGMVVETRVVNSAPYKEIADFIRKNTGVELR